MLADRAVANNGMLPACRHRCTSACDTETSNACDDATARATTVASIHRVAPLGIPPRPGDASSMTRARLRDIGFATGSLPPGRLNAITDVAGVRVGFATLVRDEP